MYVHLGGTAAGAVGSLVVTVVGTGGAVGVDDLCPEPAGGTELGNLHEVVGAHT